MRSPLTKRVRDAESELNLPPGFRFHPTDEELIVHYLRRKSQSTAPPSIIADVDLYKHEPWELPEMALFGTKEWYFFTLRDRKYPNGSRPNRVTGNGYWKATGADKPIKSKSDQNTTDGIKKALVFYAGKGPKGIKTNWIMHEYRLQHTNNATISKWNDWVLCRLYNKKNNPKEMIITQDNNSGSLDSLESDGEFGGNFEGEVMFESLSKVKGTSEQSCMGLMESLMQKCDHDDRNEWLDGLNLEDLQRLLEPESLTKVKGTSEQCNMGLMGSLMQKEDQNDGNEWLDSLSLEDLQHCMEAIPMIYHPNHQYFNN